MRMQVRRLFHLDVKLGLEATRRQAEKLESEPGCITLHYIISDERSIHGQRVDYRLLTLPPLPPPLPCAGTEMAMMSPYSACSCSTAADEPSS